ncbi:MAG: polysaccharide biosynthesis C-terminal domain-containing protein [Mycoplasmataceae bacterium]|nr:polysaccharide biosynthesis C-terminal domain-containing protein [Mycoplasmataceae bacterium]
MRTKRAIINFITDALPQVLILILGIVKIKLFINVLGEAKLGLYQLYNQIVAYLVLIEGGIGTALLYRLYKPIKNNNSTQINSIMSASKKIFNVIGVLILFIGLILSFFIMFFVKDAGNISNRYIQFTFILYLISQSIYYFSIPERILFDAEQKKYIPNIVFQMVALVKAILEIVIISLHLDLIELLISLIVCSLVANAIIILLCKKNHPNLNTKVKGDYSMLKDVKHLFVNTLATVLTNNIDIIIISKFVGLNYVVIYSTYNYFVEALKQFIDKISGSTFSGIGDLLLEDKKHSLKIFNEFNGMMFFIATVICVPFFFIINQFINLWYEGKIFTSSVLAILFTIILFYQTIRTPLKVFTLSSGKFKEVKIFVIFEIIINLSLSLILVNKFGIPGVLIATVISLLIADFLTKPFIILKKVLKHKSYKYYLICIANFVFCALEILWINIAFKTQYSSILECLIFGSIIGVINLIISTIYFYITKQLDFLKRFKKVRE